MCSVPAVTSGRLDQSIVRLILFLLCPPDAPACCLKIDRLTFDANKRMPSPNCCNASGARAHIRIEDQAAGWHGRLGDRPCHEIDGFLRWVRAPRTRLPSPLNTCFISPCYAHAVPEMAKDSHRTAGSTEPRGFAVTLTA